MEHETIIQAISELHLLLIDLNEILEDSEKVKVKEKLLKLINML